MLPSVNTYIENVESLMKSIDKIESECDTKILNALGDHIILSSAGLIEYAVENILFEYCELDKNPKISNFFLHSVNRYNSLNWPKIREILEHFNVEWHKEINKKVKDGTIETINSVKRHRDHIAHGTDVDVGYNNAKIYFLSVKHFVYVLGEVVLGEE